jgi:hypothetical protein
VRLWPWLALHLNLSGLVGPTRASFSSLQMVYELQTETPELVVAELHLTAPSQPDSYCLSAFPVPDMWKLREPATLSIVLDLECSGTPRTKLHSPPLPVLP